MAVHTHPTTPCPICGFGKVKENEKKIYDDLLNWESKDGTWEFLKPLNENEISLLYWEDNDDVASGEITFTKKQFEDLIDLCVELKKKSIKSVT